VDVLILTILLPCSLHHNAIIVHYFSEQTCVRTINFSIVMYRLTVVHMKPNRFLCLSANGTALLM